MIDSSRRNRTAPIEHVAGESPRISSHRRPLQPLEWVVLFHLGAMVAFATWAFGGGAEWVRTALAWGGSAGVLVLLAHLRHAENRKTDGRRVLLWLGPLAALDALTLVACLSPSFRPVSLGLDTMLVPVEFPAWRPSSARPVTAVYELWLFNALYLSAFNLLVIIRQRRTLRGFLVFMGINALALAVFGTVQKLTHATGLFFGLVESPQPFFFSSFVYHNHWGSFAILLTAACLGLTWHFSRRRESRDFLHSPAATWLVVVLTLAATVPLSGSRSCSLLMMVLMGLAAVHVLTRIFVGRRHYRQTLWLPLSGLAVAAVLAAASVWFVAQDSIGLRLAKSREQIGTMRAEGTIGARAVLYRDTWAMARDRLWFGWGTGSYPHVFQLYNTIEPNSDRLPVYYADAHSDWLQSVAEHGLVGTLLLGLCALAPLAGLRPRHFGNPTAAYLLAGCALVLVYAWVEFPFGNAAVVLTWWLAYFCAIRYARLETFRGGSAP